MEVFGDEYGEREEPWSLFDDDIDGEEDYDDEALDFEQSEAPLLSPGRSRLNARRSTVGLDPLPEPWREEKHHPRGESYYYNVETEESTDIRPSLPHMVMANTFTAPMLRNDTNELLVAFRDILVYPSTGRIEAFTKPVGRIVQGVRFIAKRVARPSPPRNMLGRLGEVVGLAPPTIWFQLADQYSDFFGRPACLPLHRLRGTYHLGKIDALASFLKNA